MVTGQLQRYRSVKVSTSHPFVRLIMPARSTDTVYIGEHRLVLFSLIGVGPHSCYWCSRRVDWVSSADTTQLIVDHLDDDGRHNVPDNLVPSCRQCNAHRPGIPVYAPTVGHGRAGQYNGRSVLTEDDVREMRSLYDSGVRQRDLVARFGLKKAQVSKIVNRTSWVELE